MSAGLCRRCGAEMLWAWTEGNKKMPIDPAVYPRNDDDANLAIVRNHLGRLIARVITAERPLQNFEHRGMPHFATCPPLVAERAAARAAAESRRVAAAAAPDFTDTDELHAARQRRAREELA